MVKISEMVNSFRRFETSPKEEVKTAILGWFRNHNSDVGHVIGERHLFQLTINWNPKQKAALEDAINELVAEDLLQKNVNGYALTKKGVEVIY